MKIVTYQAPDGATINLTAGQVQDLESWGVWPRNRSGEFCQVSHGLHQGVPTYSGQELVVLIAHLRGADPAFGRWCEHYDYSPASPRALRDYAEYVRGKAFTKSLFGCAADAEMEYLEFVAVQAEELAELREVRHGHQ